MTKLHNWAFGQSAADTERDEILQQRMQALEFVRPVHLEIPDASQGVEQHLAVNVMLQSD